MMKLLQIGKPESRRVFSLLCGQTRRALSSDDRFKYLSEKRYWDETYTQLRRGQGKVEGLGTETGCGEGEGLVEGVEYDAGEGFSKGATLGKNDGGFEWLADYCALRPHISPLLPSRPYSLLDLGCGSSILTHHLMYDSAVPLEVTALDFSQGALVFQEHVFRDFRSSHKCRHAFKTLAGDVTDLPIDDTTFDVILDKGTLDSVLKDPFDGRKNAARVLHECMRVLRVSGTLLQVTDEDPELRLTLMESLSLGVTSNFKVISTANDTERFLYQYKKTER